MEIKYSKLPQPRSDGMKYILDEDYVVYLPLFNRSKTLKKGMMSDGATGVRDLGMGPWWIKLIVALLSKIYQWFPKGKTDAWYLHDGFCQKDEFCTGPYFDDGFPVTNFVASTILATRLHRDKYWIESYTWWLGTLVGGGKYIKQEVGWFWIKDAILWERKKVFESYIWVKKDKG